MLRGLEWGLYIYESWLVRAKIVEDEGGSAVIHIDTIGKGNGFYCVKPLNKAIANELEQVNFPENAALENLNTNSLFKNGCEVVRVLDVYADPEVGGVFVQYVTVGGNYAGVTDVQELQSFISDYEFKEVA
jgi:hypothetical protein